MTTPSRGIKHPGRYLPNFYNNYGQLKKGQAWVRDNLPAAQK